MSLLVIYKLYDLFKIFTSMKVIWSFRAQCPNDEKDLGSHSLQMPLLQLMQVAV